MPPCEAESYSMCGLMIKVEKKKVALINFAHKRWHQTKKAKPNNPDFLHPCKQHRGVFFTLLFSPCKEFPKSSRFSDLKICLHVDERSNRKGKASLVQKQPKPCMCGQGLRLQAVKEDVIMFTFLQVTRL